MNLRKSSVPALAFGIALAVSSPSAPATPASEPLAPVHVEIGEAISIERELTEVTQTTALIADVTTSVTTKYIE